MHDIETRFTSGGPTERSARREPRRSRDREGSVSYLLLCRRVILAARHGGFRLRLIPDFLLKASARGFDGMHGLRRSRRCGTASGRGYPVRIDKPDAPRHAHFPPGYPGALALVWRWVGSVAAAHVFSLLCTVAAVLVAWRWFRAIYPSGPAFILGMSLAVNWSWGRSGGSIQSEAVLCLVGVSRRPARGPKAAANVIVSVPGIVSGSCPGRFSVP